jgi:colanic acid biosynthesis glycosyl transferase WcaI
MPERPRLLVLNQYYAPGYEATAQLLAALCEELARDYEVTVITGRVAVVDDVPMGRHLRNSVAIIRVRSTSYDRSRLLLRAANYLTYLLESARAALSVPRPDVVLCMTDPPIVPTLALIVARRFRAPLVVVSQDVFPEIAVQLKRLESGVVVAILRVLINFALRRADRVVVIGERMRDRMVTKGVDADRLEVISNWTDVAALRPQPRDNDWSLEHGLTGKFVVMHSGNVGHAQNLDALIRAATFLRDLGRLEILIIGAGARLAELTELSEVLEVGSVRFLPYQPREVLADSLSAADVHVVGLAPGLAGYVVPSRLFNILSVGRPVIAAADEDSETALVVARVGCGIVVPPGRPELLAATIRDAYDGKLDLAAMGARARVFAEEEADRRVAFSRYRAVLGSVRPLA